jgi:RNA polymerase subunit RPABC4/transcription elongation factor Spt4
MVFIVSILVLALAFILTRKTDSCECDKTSNVTSCSNCGYAISQEYNYCPNCKEQLKRRCESCGKMINVNWRRCPYCG